jgi:hypothetical protein
MFTPQEKNALKIAGIVIVLLILIWAAPLLGIIALFIGVPAMLYFGFFNADAPFPKSWKNPFK